MSVYVCVCVCVFVCIYIYDILMVQGDSDDDDVMVLRYYKVKERPTMGLAGGGERARPMEGRESCWGDTGHLGRDGSLAVCRED